MHELGSLRASIVTYQWTGSLPECIVTNQLALLLWCM